MTEAAGARQQRPRIALDAMGGDRAPDAIVAGAVAAWREGIDVVLVGEGDSLRRALESAGQPGGPALVPAPEAILMGEDPAIALRSKRGASIRIAARMVATGQADALVSAGSTGATLAAALLEIGRIPGVRRPAVAVVLPVGERGAVLIDAGASADVQPETVVAYAHMGAAYARVRGVARPRIGLLNVGAEPGKGNALARAAFELLTGMPGFVGNLEPGAVVGGNAEVVVTDGFTGNVFLKTMEALTAAGGSEQTRQGGAVLLGVAGDVLVAHGAAGPREVAAALRTAEQVARARLSVQVAQELAGLLEGDREAT